MIAGVNVDFYNPVGRPSAARLKGFQYVRFGYNVSKGTGSLDFAGAAAFYRSYLGPLQSAGIKGLAVLTHQTYGEARGYDWKQMDDARWGQYVTEFVAAARIVALHHAGDGLTFQIGNENDNAHHTNVASVYMPPAHFGRMVNESYEVINAIRPGALILVGGLVSGPGLALPYIQEAAIIRRPNLVFAVHLYGVGAGDLYNVHGTIESQLTAYAPLRTEHGPWITEFGLLGRPNEPVERVATYARVFRKAASSQAGATFWYGWGEGMHDGYGVEKDGQIRQALFDALTDAQAVAIPAYSVGSKILKTTQSHINLRDEQSRDIGDVLNGAEVTVLSTGLITLKVDGREYNGQKVRATVKDGSTREGYLALTTAFRLEDRMTDADFVSQMRDLLNKFEAQRRP